MVNKEFDPTLGLEDTIYTLNKTKKTVLSTKTEYDDPILSRAVSDTLRDSTESFWEPYYDAKNYSLEALVLEEYFFNMYSDRNRDIRNAKVIAKMTGREDWEIWRSMEDMEDIKDFGKKAWEAIKAAVKKLILMVINLIKSIGNFIKGAVAKAQEFFWKKYAAKVKKEMKTLTAKDSVTVKIRSISSKEIWKEKPDKVLIFYSKLINDLASGFIVKIISSIEANEEVNIIQELKKNPKGLSLFESFGISEAKDEYKKTFPSANKVVFKKIFDIEKPEKHAVPVTKIIEEGSHLLEPATLQKFQYTYKTGMMMNKILEKQLRMVNNIERKQASGYGSRDERKENLKEKGFTGSVDSFKAALDVERTCHFMSSILIAAYGAALSARIAVFSAARKLVKKSESNDNKKDKK